MSDRIKNFERMLEQGRDGALLRFGLGSEHLKLDEFDNASEHFAVAVRLDPEYSAAWKLYAKALTGANRIPEALDAYTQGIAAAERRGDRQAAKEMQVFRRRLQKST